MRKNDGLTAVARALDPKILSSLSKANNARELTDKSDMNSECFYFHDDIEIPHPEIIKSYANRLRELCDPEKNGKRKITQDDLAKVCGVSKQAISNIFNGNVKSVNIKYCNSLAKYFKCSVFFLLGLTDDRYGMIVNSATYRFPIIIADQQEAINIAEVGQWAKRDPALFLLVAQLFQADDTVRQTIYGTLKLMLRPTK